MVNHPCSDLFIPQGRVMWKRIVQIYHDAKGTFRFRATTELTDIQNFHYYEVKCDMLKPGRVCYCSVVNEFYFPKC